MKATLWCVVGGAMLLLVAVVVSAQEEPVDPRILAYDKGPAKIDVSKYPADMQARYKIFAKKCGTTCHTLARPINCELALDDEWERSIELMAREAGSFISADEVKEIFEFVTYDSKVRKKQLYERRLKEAEGS